MIILENISISKNTITYRGWEIFYDSIECAWIADKTGESDIYGNSIERCCIRINEIEDKNVKI